MNPVWKGEVVDAVKRMKGRRKTPGLDGIPEALIIKPVGPIIKWWSRCFNLCVREGTLEECKASFN